MTIQTPPTHTTQLPVSHKAGFARLSRRLYLLVALGFTFALSHPAQAGLMSTVTLGPANAPYTYDLTVEFANSDYYNFILRSTAATLAGDTFINTVASYPQANMTVDQQFFSGLGYYVNGITVGNDTSTGYNSTTGQFWAYWNGTATNPVQWTSPQTYGESGRTLTPGQADGWVYSTGSNQPQAVAFAVPEPGTWACLALPLMASLLYRRTRRVATGSPVGT